MVIRHEEAASSPEVSILVPTYNRATLIAECLDSALRQTVDNIELVVIDNASTDGTWAVIESYARRDSRVRAYQNASNIGPVRNWKRCAQEARAPLAKLLFSDDMIDGRFLETTIPWLDDPATAFVFTEARIGDAPHGSTIAYAWRKTSRRVSSDRFVLDAVPDRGNVPVSPGAALFRTRDVRANLVEDIDTQPMADLASHGAGPDVLLYLLTARRYRKVAFVAEPLVFFRSHAESITVRNVGGAVSAGYADAYRWFALRHMAFPGRHRALARLVRAGRSRATRRAGAARTGALRPADAAVVEVFVAAHRAAAAIRLASRRVARAVKALAMRSTP